jgi:HAD superfamily hydrolase (TIGR01484 family)
MKNNKVFLLLTDIDSTFTPIGTEGILRFVNLIKKIESRENVKVKLGLITGRQLTYVLAITNMLRWIFKEQGLENIIDYAGVEQGSIILEVDNPDSPIMLNSAGTKTIEQKVKNIVSKSKIAKYLLKSKYNMNLIAYFIKPEYREKLPQNMQVEILTKLRDLVENSLKDEANVSFAKDCVEILPANSGKDKAIDWIIENYSKKYQIVGTTFSGDSDNDYLGVKRMLELGKDNNKNIKVIIPDNSSEKLQKELEKYDKEKAIKSNKKLFEGIMDELEKIIIKGSASGRTNPS